MAVDAATTLVNYEESMHRTADCALHWLNK